MNESSDEYLLQIKVKNNLLYSQMRERGYRNAAALAKAVGIDPSRIGAMLNLQMSVYNKSLEMRPPVARVLDFLGLMPEEAFPAEVMFDSLPGNSGEVTVGSEEMARIAFGGERHVDADSLATLDEVKRIATTLLDGLPKREKLALEMRTNGATLREVGKAIGGISPERTRQIVAQAERRCRTNAIKMGLWGVDVVDE